MRAVVVVLHAATEQGEKEEGSERPRHNTDPVSLRVRSIDAASFFQRVHRGPINHGRSSGLNGKDVFAIMFAAAVESAGASAQ